MPNSRPFTRDKLRNIAVIATDQLSIFELAVAAEVFGIDRTDDGVPAYDFAVCSVGRGPLRSQAGFSMTTQYGLERTYSADLVIVPGWVVAPGQQDPPVKPPKKLIKALRDAVDRGASVASFCSGVFVLAHAGLLDGRRATTHYRYAEKLAEQFPLVEVDPDVLFVMDGPVFTSAGTSAAIDLCLQLVRDSDGPAVASKIARRMVVPPQREGGQAQYVERPVPARSQDNAMSQLLDELIDDLGSEHNVDQLAARVLMSPRSFARRFKEETGTTPYKWILQQRIRRAQQLLEGTDLDIERIAREVGFNDSTTLRVHFNRIVRTTPTAYRRTFRCSQTMVG